ncbi:ArnT family glycosyltransferase [Halovenus sp. HT40]|uniref:ArnT family glycosyltransferase n=1 Tax=Halovenus sp. HT40 TaxID=3126691 RepID=UPI00300ECAF4
MTETDSPLGRAVERGRGWLTRDRQATLVLAVLTGVVVYLVGEGVFPYYTSNHDEAVYLQQAEMLLEGQLRMSPPAEESFRPWFFIEEDGSMYPKYTPVTAGLFALGGLVGSYRLAVAVIAVFAVALTDGVVSEVFDDRTGLLAAGLLVVSPMFVVQAAVFLPYVPAFTLNLCFAWAYLRADRTGGRRFAALAGGAIGLSFWARPYTAVLFATPFVCHALWTLRTLDRKPIVRQSIVAVLGLCGVAVALGYNAVITGDPLTFPYEVFAPRDGLGFGERQITGYERDYTPELAVEANARNLWQYVTRWTPAGLLGTAVAVIGAGAVLRNPEQRRDPRVLAVLGTFVTITVGNVYFWGTLNVLGDLSDPSDGLISILGPYYHVGLLLSTVTLGAVGLTALAGAATQLQDRLSGPAARALPVLGVVAILVVAGVTAGAVAAPLTENYETTEEYERAYEPIEEQSFENGLVFLPTPYGDWLNHPFQELRNDPDFDSKVLYALQHREFAVVDAFPERTLYRYTYRDQWLPFKDQPVRPQLREIEHVSGEQIRLNLTLGVPDNVETVELRASVGEDGNSTAAALTDEIEMTATVADGNVTLRSPSFEQNLTVAHDGEQPLRLVTFVDYGALGGFEYVAEMPLIRDDGEYRALSPYLEVCREPFRCGGEAAYIPGEHRDGVSMNATVSASG